MKALKAKRGIRHDVLFIILFFGLFILFPSASLADEPASGGESGGGATQELTGLEILSLGALGVIAIAVLAEALDEDDAVVPTHGAHGAHH